MNRRNLPPQAYTRDTLAKAFEWLKTQPEGVRSIASEADSLVTLYLQSRRARKPKNTKSSEDFRSDLKNLAYGLKHFDDEDGLITDPMPPTSTYEQAAPVVEPRQQAPLINHDVPPAALRPPTVEAQRDPTPKPEAMAKPTAKNLRPPAFTPATKAFLLDAQSMELIQAAKRRLNLSQDSEVLRMLLLLGSEKLSQALPPQN